MKRKVKVAAIFLTMFIVVTVLVSCGKEQSSFLEQYVKQVQQVKDDYMKLEERIKALESQVKSLNEELYRNGKRTEALEEVYDYVAQDNSMPGTGEEPPLDALP